jgi:DNA-directed RNA polymerase subunit omega
VRAERVRRTRIEDQIRPILETFQVEEVSTSWLTKPRNNAHCTIPDDPEQSTYRFIIVAAKRARQLQGGARPVLPTSSKKPTIIAMEEVRRGSGEVQLTGPAPEPAGRRAAALEVKFDT